VAISATNSTVAAADISSVARGGNAAVSLPVERASRVRSSGPATRIA
jgi:hypothetical protein